MREASLADEMELKGALVAQVLVELECLQLQIVHGVREVALERAAEHVQIVGEGGRRVPIEVGKAGRVALQAGELEDVREAMGEEELHVGALAGGGRVGKGDDAIESERVLAHVELHVGGPHAPLRLEQLDVSDEPRYGARLHVLALGAQRAEVVELCGHVQLVLVAHVGQVR